MLPQTLLIAGILIGASPAHSLGFGTPPSSVELGRGLDYSLPLRIDAGESLDPGCVTAEVYFGERRVAPSNVRWAVSPGSDAGQRVLRVITLVTVDEPVVTVQVMAGCASRVTRRFTAFADPVATTAAPLLAEVPAAAVEAPAAAVAPVNPNAAPPVAARPNTQPNAAAKPTARRSLVAQRQPKRGKASRALAAASSPAPVKVAATPPRLRLEPAEPLRAANAASAVEAAASAVAAALQAATAAQNAASSATERAQAMQGQIERLLAEAQLQRREAAELQARRAAAEARAGWLPWLGAVAAVLLAAAVWLALRWRHARRQVHSRWWSGAEAEAEAAAQAKAEVARAQIAHAAPPPTTTRSRLPDEPISQVHSASRAPSTQPAPTGVEPMWTTTTPPRPVSAEELLDLEQQAEFFVVLGQDDSAVDLLVSHIRSTGGLSPLPYLKLLEIYRRRGERGNYDRTRERFNLRFNAYAPEWDTDMLQGKTLEDYPQIVRLTQRAWPRPLAAMAELEAMLFRKDDGEVFELPAYREVLLLYSLARDLLDNQVEDRGDIDLLLPLDDRARAARAAPALDDTRALRPEPTIERAAARKRDLDLDLSEEDARLREVTTPAVFIDAPHDGDSRVADLDEPPRLKRVPRAR